MAETRLRAKPCDKGKDCCGYKPCQRKKIGKAEKAGLPGPELAQKSEDALILKKLRKQARKAHKAAAKAQKAAHKAEKMLEEIERARNGEAQE